MTKEPPSRLAATRVAWALHSGEYPHGPVKARNGDDADLRVENLIEVVRGPTKFASAAGGKRSSLERRAETDKAFIAAMRDNPQASIAQISRLVGMSEPCVCVRLAKLEAASLTCGPRCQAAERWRLSEEGRRVAGLSALFLDELDRELMQIVARMSSMTTSLIAAHAGTNEPRARRRLKRLAEQGLAWRDHKGRWRATAARLKALGEVPAPVARWLSPEAVSAAQARDVVDRRNAGMSRAEPSRHGREARMRMEAAQRGHRLAAAE